MANVEPHTPGRPTDPAGVKALTILAHKAFANLRPSGVKVHAGAVMLEDGLTEADFEEMAKAGVRLVAEREPRRAGRQVAERPLERRVVRRAVRVGIERTLPDGSRRVVAGVASMPALRERVWAVEGGGAWWERQGQPAVPARVGAPAPSVACR